MLILLEIVSLSCLVQLQEVKFEKIKFYSIVIFADASLPASCSDQSQPRTDVTAFYLHTPTTNACMAVRNEGHHDR